MYVCVYISYATCYRYIYIYKYINTYDLISTLSPTPGHHHHHPRIAGNSRQKVQVKRHLVRVYSWLFFAWLSLCSIIVAIPGYSWLFVAIRGYFHCVAIFLAASGYFLSFCGYSWLSVAIRGYSWLFLAKIAAWLFFRVAIFQKCRKCQCSRNLK